MSISQFLNKPYQFQLLTTKHYILTDLIPKARKQSGAFKSVSFVAEQPQAQAQAGTSSKIIIEDEKYGTLLKPVSSNKVRFKIAAGKNNT